MKNFKYIFKETLTLIDYKSKIFFTNLLLVIISFILINFFAVFSYNLLELKNNIDKNVQVKILVKDNVEKDVIATFEKEILKDDLIAYYSYRPKQIAIKALEDKLNLDLLNENSLPDSIVVYLKPGSTIDDVKKIKSILEEKDIVREVIFNEKIIRKIIRLRLLVRKLIYMISGVFVVPLFLLIYLIIRLNFINYEKEIQYKYKKIGNGGYALYPYVLKKFFTILIGWLTGTLLFIPFYNMLDLIMEGLNPLLKLVKITSLPIWLYFAPLGISMLMLLFSMLFTKVEGEE